MQLAHLLQRRFAGTLAASGAAVLLALCLGHGIRMGWLEPNSTAEPQVTEGPRPQTPEKPYPWIERDAEFSYEGIRLAGTLALPTTSSPEAPVLAVLLISGAGPQDRDGTFFEHKRFLVWTEALVRAGHAVLRVDDRGVGASEGVLLDAGLPVLAGDALEAVDWLQAQPEIDARRVGLLGLSLGGVVGMLAAAESPDVAFLILASTMGRPGAELLVAQQDRLLKAQGAREVDRARLALLTRRAISLTEGLSDVEQAREELRPIVRRLAELASRAGGRSPGPLSMAPSESSIERQIDLLLSPQMQDTLFLDPSDALRRVRCPVLVVHGELDIQVDAELNVPRLVEALRLGAAADGRDAAVTVHRFPGLNHLLQPAETGLPDEYAEIETTLAPEMLAAVVAWLGELE